MGTTIESGSSAIATAPAKSPALGSRWTRVRVLGNAHEKPISSVKFSNDGAFVATASADSTVRVWSTAALLSPSLSSSSGENPQPQPSVEPLLTLHGHDQGVSDVSWSRDGAYLVSASDDRTLRVWDVDQQKCVAVLGTPTHNSSFLFSGLPLDNTGATSGHATTTTTTTSSSTNSSSTSSARSTGGSTSMGSGFVLSDDTSDDGHATYVFCCEFNPQGSLIASGSFDETIRLWDVRTGRCLVRLTAHQEPVSCVDFNRDGTLLVTSSYDGLVRVWDVATMQCLREIILEPSVPATFARFTPNSQHLLVGTMDGQLSVWDFMTPKKPQCVKSYAGHVNKKYCLAAGFLQDGDTALLLCGSEDGRVVVWDVNTQIQVDAWPSSSGSVVLGLSVHPTQRHVATVSEQELTIWSQVE